MARSCFSGELQDLRAAVPQPFVDIRYRGTAPDWSAVAPSEVVEIEDGHARLRVHRGIDLATVVAVVRDTTELTSFTYQPPTLSELFRQAVAA